MIHCVKIGCILLLLIGVSCNTKKDVAQSEKITTADQPRFIIIFADDLGYSDLGCFGSKLIRTPNLDKIAQEGMRFTNFYAQTVCGPSRAALMTGSYPMRIAQWNNERTLHPGVHPKEVLIPEVLKSKNYATACVGKWHLARHSQTDFEPHLMPNHQGFDYFFGTPSSNDKIVRLFKNDQVVEESANMATLTKRYTDQSIDFIKKNKDKPFFLYLAYSMPHVIIDASPQFKGKSKRGLYGDVIEEIDWNVGRIMNELKTQHLDDNTYVIFMSDNGPWFLEKHPLLLDYKDEGGFYGGSSDPFRGHKTSTWEGGLRTPTLFWGPKIPANTVNNEVASTLDILPTIAALAGISPPTDRIIDGENIQSLLYGELEEFESDRVFYYYQADHLQAVRKGKWKLHIPSSKIDKWHIFHKTEDWVNFDEPALFNLNDDEGETANLASQFPDVVEELKKEFNKALEDLGTGKQLGSGVRQFN